MLSYLGKFYWRNHLRINTVRIESMKIKPNDGDWAILSVLGVNE
jgi:hypothetical protein